MKINKQQIVSINKIMTKCNKSECDVDYADLMSTNPTLKVMCGTDEFRVEPTGDITQMKWENIITQLRRPFAPEYVDWKVQTSTNDSALVVAYTDARDVSERLNKVCPGQWSHRHSLITVGNEVLGVECALTISDGESVTVHTDVGVGDLDDDRMKAGLKTHYSDALKRAAVHFGVNSCLYELPQVWLNGNEYLRISGDKVRGINPNGKAHLAERYERWVQLDVVKERFGTPYPTS